MDHMDASSHESETAEECLYCECAWATAELCHATEHGKSGACQQHPITEERQGLGSGVLMMCCNTSYATVAETLNHTCESPVEHPRPLKKRMCEGCGVKAPWPIIRSRQWFIPNPHDDGYVDICEACWIANPNSK